LTGQVLEKNKYDDAFSWELPDHHEESNDDEEAGSRRNSTSSKTKPNGSSQNDINLGNI
jgi:hypothetical protein